MKRFLFLTERNYDEEVFSFILPYNDLQIEWNVSPIKDKFLAIFCLVFTTKELEGILEKYKIDKGQNYPLFLIYMDGKMNDYLTENHLFDGIIPFNFFKEFFPKKLFVGEYDGIFFRVKNRLEKILFKEIIWIQAKDIYAIIKTKDARYLVSNTLGEIDERLKPFKIFQRIHRSFLINTTKIEAIEDKNALVAGEYIPIGQAYRDELFSKLLFI